MTVLKPAAQIVLPKGYAMRPARLSDLDAAIDLFNACSRALHGRDEFKAEDIRFEWTLPDTDLEKSMRVVLSPEGQMVGYIEVWDTHAQPVHPWVWGRVHPDYEGQGIGTALLTWADERCHLALEKCPPEARVSYRVGYEASYQPAAKLYTSLGFQPLRHSWTMLIEFDETPVPQPMPDGFSIRLYQHPQDLRLTYQAVRDSFQDHFGYVEEPFEHGVERWRSFIEGDQKFDESLWFLAVDNATGEIAGISLCRIEAHHDSEQGWVSTLGVCRPYRRQGLGLALLQHSFVELWKRGKRKVGLGVDASSLTGATRLYEKAGMRVDRQMTMYEKEIRPGVEISTTSVNG